MRIIQIHSMDGSGGGGVTYHLMNAPCKNDQDSELLVGSVKLSQDSRVKYLIFSASGLKRNAFKDYQCLHETVKILGSSGQDVLCIALGDTGDSEFIGESVEIWFIPFVSDTRIVAQYYQAADVYVHPAKADTFPTSVIEAEACGLPVVASAVCGITEQIIEGETGYLVPSGGAEMMAERILQLKEDVGLREMMGENAAKLAKERYDVKVMVGKYLEYYQNVVNDSPHNSNYEV